MSMDPEKLERLIADAIEDCQDGVLDDQQVEKLRELLATSPAARKAYQEHNFLTHLIASKHLLDGGTIQPASGVGSMPIEGRSASRKSPTPIRWLPLAIAASLLIGLSAVAIHFSEGQRGHHAPFAIDVSTPPAAISLAAYRPDSSDAPVAVLLKSEAANWNTKGLANAYGVPLRAGWLDLAAGTASIRFNAGAVATLIGPARFELLDSQQGFLAHGNVVANVPPQAKGFQIHTEQMQLTDLGTEFGVRVGVDEDTEVHVINGLVEVESTQDDSEKFEMRENEAKKFALAAAPANLPVDGKLADSVVASRPDQRIGYYTFDSIEDDEGTWSTNPSAQTVGGDDVTFHNFAYTGIEPGPFEFTRNLNRWSFKGWRPNYRGRHFYFGFKVTANSGKQLQLNSLSLELFRAGGNDLPELAPQDGIVRVSSDGFKTFQRFVLLDQESFVLEPKFVSIDAGKIEPAAEYEFRFLFKGQTKARAIRVDEVTLDLDVIDDEAAH